MNYIEFVNKLIREKVSDCNKLVIYGQNVSAGSCVSGLARGLKNGNGCTVINSTNSENTLVGIGFGLMLKGISSIFIMKQQDFLLLGIDQLVNTYNVIRRMNLGASFTILPIIVDSGYEGPQSCLNNFNDFCSISRIPGYTINNKHDAENIINHHLISPGVRIIGVSQRLFRTDIIEMDDDVITLHNHDVHHYKYGNAATIVSFNFTFPQAFDVWKSMKNQGLEASLFSVNGVIAKNWQAIVEDVKKTGKVVIIDDSKSVNNSSDRFLVELYSTCTPNRVVVLKREYSDEWHKPNPDLLNIDPGQVIQSLQ